MPCPPHYYRIEVASKGDMSKGRCAKCGEAKIFLSHLPTDARGMKRAGIRHDHSMNEAERKYKQDKYITHLDYEFPRIER